MKRFLSLLLCLIIITFTTNVYAASSSISAKTSSTKLEYIDELEIYYNKASSYNLYILNIDTEYNSTTTLSDPEEVNGGLQYIMNNSNPTSSSNKNYYITQVAILWYEDYLNGNNNNISSEMKNFITENVSKDTNCYYINKLVNDAKKYSEESEYIVFKDRNIEFQKSGSYYYSNEITVFTNNLSSTPTIGFYNAPTSTKAVIKDSLEKNGEGSFQIRIPESSYDNFSKDYFEVYVSGNTSSTKYYKYSNYGLEEAIYDRSYSSNSTNVRESLPVELTNINNISFRVKVLNNNDKYISGVKYDLYKGNCRYSTCNENDYLYSFTSTNTYTTLTNNLTEGQYTLVLNSNKSNYEFQEKLLFTLKDSDKIQQLTIRELDNKSKVFNIKVENPLNDSDNVIKVYDNKNNLIDSFRADNSTYTLKLESGNDYSIIDSKGLLKVYFDIDTNGDLYVFENEQKKLRTLIDLDNYLLRYTTDEELNNNNNANNNNTNNNNNNNNANKDNNNGNANVYENEDGSIYIDNLDNVDSIKISQDIKTTTDVVVNWISNVVDCPPTSVTSTLKYVIGAIVLALGTILTIKNVKKSKNNM